MEYRISKDEISRRKKAFLTLSISLMIGLILASIISDFIISFIFYLSFAIALLASNVLLFSSFKLFLLIKITLSEQFIERSNNKGYESFLVTDITRIRIKRTTKKSIREISIYFRNGKSLAINALEDFEQFLYDLIISVNENTVIKEIHEPINFDHPLFYSLLGQLISFIGVYLMKLVLNMGSF